MIKERLFFLLGELFLELLFSVVVKIIRAIGKNNHYCLLWSYQTFSNLANLIQELMKALHAVQTATLDDEYACIIMYHH